MRASGLKPHTHRDTHTHIPDIHTYVLGAHALYSCKSDDERAAVDGRLYASPRAMSIRAPAPAGVGPATVQFGADGRLYASPTVDARLYASPTVMTPLGPVMLGGAMF